MARRRPHRPGAPKDSIYGRRSPRSHKRTGGTSTQSLASVPFDPSIGAIGVATVAAGLDQQVRIGTTATILHLVGDSRDRCARAEHELAVYSLFGRETRVATTRIGRHHHWCHAVTASERAGAVSG